MDVIKLILIRVCLTHTHKGSEYSGKCALSSDSFELSCNYLGSGYSLSLCLATPPKLSPHPTSLSVKYQIRCPVPQGAHAHKVGGKRENVGERGRLRGREAASELNKQRSANSGETKLGGGRIT